MERVHRALFGAILIGFFGYAAVWIWQSSVAVHGERFFLLADDPMISMRYARNLASGYGLVWNPGQAPVEGFSNPLWVAIMAAAHLLPLPSSKIPLVIQLLCVALLAGSLFAVHRFTLKAGGDHTAALGATFLTAFSYAVAAWGLSGWEVALIVPLIVTALVIAGDAVAERRFPLTAYLLLAGGTFVRLDLAVAYVAMMVVVLAYEPQFRARHTAIAVAMLITALGVQTACRLAYFGAAFPNTYYLKMTGYPTLWRVGWGVRFLAGTIWRQQPLLYVFVALPLLVRRTPGVVLATAVVASQFLYSAYAGLLDNRFVTTVMPLVFVLFAIGARITVDAIADRWTMFASSRAATFAAICLVALVLFGGGITPWRDALLRPPTDESLIQRAAILEASTAPDATVAVVAAGTLPYLLPRPAIDLLGKNDALIAHEPAQTFFQRRSTPYMSGHTKWDYAYSIGTLKPDVIADLWQDVDSAEPYLGEYQRVEITGHVVYLRKDSPRIRWEAVYGE